MMKWVEGRELVKGKELEREVEGEEDGDEKQRDALLGPQTRLLEDRT